MLKLYNKEHEAISAILNVKDYKIEYLLSGEDSLEFSLSISDENINLLQEECYIRNELNEYVVKEIDPSNDFKRFNCILNLEDIKAKSIFNFETENNNIDDTIRLAIAGTGWVLVDSNITKRRTVRLKNTNALEVLREIRKVFKIDYRFDSINKKIYVYEQYGSDKGVYFSDELNLTDLKFPSDTYEYITRIIPIGKDGLKISSVNGGKEYIDNFQYTNKVIEYIWEDNRYTDAQSLKDDAIAKLNELSKPKKVYEANVYDLAKYSDEYNFLEFFLGDTITILSKKDNFKDNQRIVKYIQYPKEPYKNTCELGNTTLTFEELQQENEYKNQVINNITTDNNTLDGSKVDEISTNQIRDFDVEVGRVVNLEAVNAKIDNLVATDVNITGQLNAVKADIGTLNANVANIDELVVKHTATINELNSNKANISDLNATNATIDILESKVANINRILAGNITADNIQAGTITAGSGIIADGAIGNAQISSIDAGKIEAGTIDTSKITVAGPNSNLKITGNRLQVFTGIGSNQFERVSLGDINGDGSIYGFRVRGADGQTILIDENGVKEEGITNGSITNEKISDNANIDGSKLDINSVIRNINKDGTEVIRGTKINVNGTNLETKLSTITQKQTEDSERITQAYSKITANENKINLKVDNQTYQTDKNNINTTLNKNTSEISLLKDKIALKVEQTDITNAINNIQVGGRNLFILNQIKDYAGGALRENKYYTLKGNRVIATNQPLSSSLMGMKVSVEYSKELTISCKSNIPSVYYYFRCYDSNNNITQQQLSGIFKQVKNGYFQITFNNIPQNTSYINIGLGSTSIANYWLEEIKIEKGTKSTDWSPAPEDINAEILAVDSKTTTINNKVSEITANLNSITQRVSSTETTTTSLTTQMNAVDGKINTAKNEAITGARRIPDARSRNENPLWYMQNYPSQTITEFKYSSIVGIPGNQVYGTLETKVPWPDKSGGYPVQTFRSNSTATYERKGLSDTTWGPWKQIEDTSGSQSKATQALNDAKSYTNIEITKTNNKVSSIETNLNGITQRVTSTETTTTNLTNKLNNLQIGGRNLIKNSLSIQLLGTDTSNNTTHSIIDSNKGYFKITINNNNKWNRYQWLNNNIDRSFTANLGEQYTISMDIRVNKLPQNDLRFSFNVRTSNSDVYGAHNDIAYQIKKPNVWIRIFSTVSLPTDNDKRTSVLAVISSYTGGQQGLEIEYKNLKLEKGNKGTDWSPAPEDINKEVTEVKEKVSDIVLDVNTITSTVKNNYYTKNDIDSKGYQTVSQVQQTVNELQIKFTESGGYNLLRNGGAKNGITFWKSITSNNFKTISDTTSQNTTSSGTVFAVGCNTTTEKTAASYRFLVKPNTKYTISFSYYIGYNSTGLDVYWLESDTITEKDNLNNTSYTTARNLLAESSYLSGKYRKRTITITTSTNAKSCYIRLDNNGTKDSNTSYTYFTDIMVSEGELALPWSPHPSEIYDGITTIDKDGITVTSSNVKSKTSMTANGFKITKTDTNTDVFKVASDGNLEIQGSIITNSSSGARAELKEDSLRFYNTNNNLAGKISYLYDPYVPQGNSKEILWVRSASGYALKLESQGSNASLEANKVYISAKANDGVIGLNATRVNVGAEFHCGDAIYGEHDLIRLGYHAIEFSTVGQTKFGYSLKLNNSLIAVSENEGNSIHFLCYGSNSMLSAQVYGGGFYARGPVSRSLRSINNTTALEEMQNTEVIINNNKRIVIPKIYSRNSIDTSTIGLTKTIDYKTGEENINMDYNTVISTLWQAVLELSEKSNSLEQELEDLKQSLK